MLYEVITHDAPCRNDRLADHQRTELHHRGGRGSGLHDSLANEQVNAIAANDNAEEDQAYRPADGVSYNFV